MERHAYLIIAHSNLEQLQQLLLLLDDPRNDIYIHLDLKSKLDIKKITPPHMKYSHCRFCERVDVRWGNVSLIQAEMNLFELASQVEHAYYHLISGIDLPLHSQDYIHRYFEGKNFEYIGYSPKWDMRERVYCHNLFMQYMRFPNQYIRGGLQKMRQLYNKLQILVGYKMKQPDYEFKAGCEWVSVTHDFVLSLLENKDEILKMYQYAYCPDEIYKQTFAYNSEFRNRIYNVTDEFEGCLREIDWKRGRPYIWRKEDYDYLSHSNKLFARKFDENVDEEIINMLINKIKNESNS